MKKLLNYPLPLCFVLQRIIFSYGLLLILCSCKPAICQLSSEDPNISISLSCFKEQVGISEPNQVLPKLILITDANFLDPIVLKLTITNKSTKEISVLYPDLIHRTAILSFRDTTSGQQVPNQVRWIGGISSDYILIQPGKSYEALLYLEQIYPNGISSGTYEISLQYTANYNKPMLQTNSISLKIASPSEVEKKLSTNYRRYQDGLEIGEQFLKENSIGYFRGLVSIRMAREQIQVNNFEAASNIFETIVSDESSTTFQKGEALYLKARLLKDNMGKLDEAIECLEKSPLRSAYVEVEQWKKEKELKLQQQDVLNEMVLPVEMDNN